MVVPVMKENDVQPRGCGCQSRNGYRVRCANHQQQYEQSLVYEEQIKTAQKARQQADVTEERLMCLEQSVAVLLSEINRLRHIERLVEALQSNDQVSPEALQAKVDSLFNVGASREG